MEHLWSPAGATGGNRWQMGRPRKRLKQADPQPVATHGNRSGAHGKEGVDGSSPSEGSYGSRNLRGFVLCGQRDPTQVARASACELWTTPSLRRSAHTLRSPYAE